MLSLGRPKPSTDPVNERAAHLALLLLGVGYNISHHNGLMGTTELANGTRLADWIDMATPFVVLGPLLWLLTIVRPNPLIWFAAMVGSILYVQGHGIHLAANSISNTTTSQTAPSTTTVVHLWDEVAGHYIWFAGLAIVLACCWLGSTTAALTIPAWPSAIVGAVTGITWATNGLEGGTAIFSLGCAAAAVTVAGRRPTATLAVPFAAAGMVAVAVLAGYGLANGGFPQPSSV